VSAVEGEIGGKPVRFTSSDPMIGVPVSLGPGHLFRLGPACQTGRSDGRRASGGAAPGRPPAARQVLGVLFDFHTDEDCGLVYGAIDPFVPPPTLYHSAQRAREAPCQEPHPSASSHRHGCGLLRATPQRPRRLTTLT
jgi:hypothetical protein